MIFVIVGIGIDIIEIERIKKAALKAAFLSRVFSAGELELYRERGHNPAILAGCFAGKEAVVKALGTGFRGISPVDIEILREESGKPVAVLSERVMALSKNAVIHISLTNSEAFAVAFVVMESR